MGAAIHADDLRTSPSSTESVDLQDEVIIINFQQKHSRNKILRNLKQPRK